MLPALFSSFLLVCHVFCRYFRKIPNFFFLSSLHMGRYSAFGSPPVWLLSKFSFLAWSSKTCFAPITVLEPLDAVGRTEGILLIELWQYPAKSLMGFVWTGSIVEFVCAYRCVQWRGKFIVCVSVSVFVCMREFVSVCVYVCVTEWVCAHGRVTGKVLLFFYKFIW